MEKSKLLEALMAEHLIKLKGNLMKLHETVINEERVTLKKEMVEVKEEEKAMKGEGGMVTEEGVGVEEVEMGAKVDTLTAEKDCGKSFKVEDIKIEPVIKDEYIEVGHSEQSVRGAFEIKDEIMLKEVKADMFKEGDPNMREMHQSNDEWDNDPMQGGQFWMLRGSGIGDLRCTDTRQTTKTDDSHRLLIQREPQAEKLCDVGLFELCNPHLLSANTIQRLLHPLHASPPSSGDVIQLARIHLSPKPQRRSRRRGGSLKRWEGKVCGNVSGGKMFQRMSQESLKRRLDFTSSNVQAAPVWDQRNRKCARYI